MDNIFYRGLQILDDIRNPKEERKPKLGEEVPKDYLLPNPFIMKQDKNLPGEEKKNKFKPYDYKLIMPPVPVKESSGLMTNSLMLKAYLQGIDNAFFQRDNFQRDYLHELPRLLYEPELSKNVGDYVMLFPNPDYYPTKMHAKKNAISYKQAGDFFYELFESGYEYPDKLRFMKKLEEAFMATLLTLEGMDPPEEKKGRKLTRNGSSIVSEQSPSSNPSKANNPVISKSPVSKEENLPNVKDLMATTPPPANGGAQGVVIGESKDIQLPEMEALNADKPVIGTLAQAPEIDLDYEQTKLRRMIGGGYYRKEGDNWVRSENKTNDFITLIRKATIVCLANQGCMMREFFVGKGSHIAIVLQIPPENQGKIAQMIHLQKRVDMAVVDLLSYEPLDLRMRPLRQNLFLNDVRLWQENYGNSKSPQTNEENLRLRMRILELLNGQFSFQRIVRKAHGNWTEDPIDIKTGIFEHEIVPIKEWMAYKDFLEELYSRMTEIERIRTTVKAKLDLHYSRDILVIRNNKSRRKFDDLQLVKFLNKLILEAFLESQNKTNEKYKGTGVALMSTWERLGFQKSEYSFNYVCPNNHQRPRRRELMKLIWKESADLDTCREIKFNGSDRAQMSNFLVILNLQD